MVGVYVVLLNLLCLVTGAPLPLSLFALKGLDVYAGEVQEQFHTSYQHPGHHPLYFQQILLVLHFHLIGPRVYTRIPQIIQHIQDEFIILLQDAELQVSCLSWALGSLLMWDRMLIIFFLVI